MNNINRNCCVCFKESALIPLNATDNNDESIISKLESVVSEVQWKPTFSICPECLKTLDMVLDFKNLCLKSSSMRFREESERNSFTDSETVILKAEESTSEAEIESIDVNSSEASLEVICKICKIQLNSQEHLYLHNKQIHSRLYKCVCCDERFNSEDEVNFHQQKYHNQSFDALCEDKSIVETVVLNQNSKSNLESSNNKLTSEKSNIINTNTLNQKNLTDIVFKCFHCNKSYKSKIILAKHIKLKHENRKIKCYECEITFSSEMQLKKHWQSAHEIKEHNGGKLYKCSKCEKSYKTEKVMKNHFETCDGVKRHSKINFKKDFSTNKCEKCNRFYTTEKILKAHIKNCKSVGVSAEKDFKCNICNIFLNCEKDKQTHVLNEHKVDLKLENTCQFCYKHFENSAEFKLHLNTNHESKTRTEKHKIYSERSYSCEVCSRIFGFVKEVIEHCVKEHQMDSKLVKPFMCNKCDTRFTSSANMIQHKQYHEGDRSHICSFCGKSYITKSDLTVHEYTHLNKRNYKCEFCERAFNTNKNLRSHMLVVHTDSSLWKYQCNMCNKKFPLKSGYDQHIRRHSGDKRFKCLICEKSFISSSELRKHITFHSNERAFKCSHCDKEYKDRRVYEIHLKKVHGIGNIKIPIRVKRFACHICPSTFFDKQKLARHLCTHTGIKPYSCTLCEKRFTDKSYLKYHLKTAHNVVDVQIKTTEDTKVLHVM